MQEIELKWEPRQEQIDILGKFEKAVRLKKKFFIVNAPVGTGKSYAIQMMAKRFQELYDGDNQPHFDLLTNQKALQDQYLRDFPFIQSIKGKDNYYCHKYSCSCSEGMELCKAFETSCTSCPYAAAKKAYQESTIGLLNFHLYVSFLTYAEDILTNRKANILFIDEAHIFEEVYCDFVNGYLSISYLEQNNLDVSPEMAYEIAQIKTKIDFANFLEKYVQPQFQKKMLEIESYIRDSSKNQNSKIQKLKDYRKISRTKCKFNRFLNDRENWKDNWTIETGHDKDGLYHKVEAIWGKKYLSEVWDKYDMVVMLSGTILDKFLFTNIMGVDLSQTSFFTVESPFKPENRKIHILDKGKMSFNQLEESYKAMVPEIKRILKKHKGEKGIIHTGNYKLSQWIERDIDDDRLLFHDSTNKDIALNRHMNSKDDTVLVSPAMINGVDLKDDLSRFQIILKIPFPAMDNERIKIRMNQNRKWYVWKTLCDLIQSYGRSIRSETDYATTYILDSNFDVLTNQIPLPADVQKAVFKETVL